MIGHQSRKHKRLRFLVETELIRAKELYFSEALSKVEKGLGLFKSKWAYNVIKALKGLITTVKKNSKHRDSTTE